MTFGPPIRRLAADVRGTSVVELALLSPILLATLAGLVDCGRLVSSKLKLQQAAERAVELATLSAVSSSSYGSLQTEAATAANVSSSNVTVTYWLECDGVVQAAGTTSCTGSTSPARFASITITDTYNWMFEQLVPSWNSQPYSVSLRGYAEVRVQ